MHIALFLSVVCTSHLSRVQADYTWSFHALLSSCSTIYRAIHSGKLDCELRCWSVRKTQAPRVSDDAEQLMRRRGKIRITLELVERPKRLQIAFVLETGKEIPSW